MDMNKFTSEKMFFAICDMLEGYEEYIDEICNHLKAKKTDNGNVLCDWDKWYKGEDRDEYELIWCMVVSLFGDSGVTVRSGWVNDVDGAIEFLQSIKNENTPIG